MSSFSLSDKRFRISRSLVIVFLFSLVSLFALAQVNLKYRLLNGYSLSTEATVNKGKPTLFVFEQAETFEQVFKAAPTSTKRPDQPNFSKEMVVGVTITATNKPPRLSVSRVFVQDSTLTVRYIRQVDSSMINNPQAFMSQPMLLIAIPKQTVLRTKLVENGRVVQTLKKKEEKDQ